VSEPVPVPVRDAATVVLLRDGAAGIEAWLLTRHRDMVFAAGMSVFPGGRVEASDASLPFADDAGAVIDDVARRFDCPDELARALVGAAVRETFEETGVLLTVPRADAAAAVDVAAARADVEAGRMGFGDMLRSAGLAADAAALEPWSRWVTPAGEVRRYDTRFFVGALPLGTRAQDVTTESSEAAWVPVDDAISQASRGERGLLPPTLQTLAGLQRYATVADALAAARHRRLDAVEPVLRLDAEGGPSVELPDGSVVAIPRGLLR
jgi:8-oxo-dGTP pyrophosphatase MutT (NUDIX family)